MSRTKKWTLGTVLAVLGIVSTLFAWGSVPVINVFRPGNHDVKFTEVDKKIEANKVECDLKIEAAEKHCNQQIEAIEKASDERMEAQRLQNVDVMKVLIRVETDIKWIKDKEENGGDPN